MASIKNNWNPTVQWEFPEKEPTDKQKKIIAGVVAEIAIKVLFKNFSYKFCGKIYHQKDGGQIGVRATGAAAKIIMEDCARQYRSILERSGNW